MAKKLEKLCKFKDVEVGQRYSMSENKCGSEYVFVVTKIEDKFVRFTYLDGLKGILPKNAIETVFEFPFSSLEKELL